MPRYSLSRHRRLLATACALATFPLTAHAADAVLPDIVVKESPHVAEKFDLPQTMESINAQQIEDAVNVVDPEDAVKYLPSIFIRKRNYGDTQPTIATRTWGVNSSARTLVFVDDVPITALIGNNNTTGAPRWGMVSPEQIDNVDMMYGPFAAAYPGNAMGGVMQITTRMPDSFQATGKQTEAFQDFNVYGTNKLFTTSESAATVGNRWGALSWFLSANHEDSFSQPLSFVTSGSVPAGTSGAIIAQNKIGQAADVVGAGGMLHTVMDNLTAKLAYDITPELRGVYSVGVWSNDGHSKVQSYLTNGAGNSTFTTGNLTTLQRSFASSEYTVDETHVMNSLSLKSDSKGRWDWEAVLTRYDYVDDTQASPASVNAAGNGFITNGYIARLGGTNWTTADLKGIWRPTGPSGAHEASFGLHQDLYVLNNPTTNTNTWTSTSGNGNGTLYTDGEGKTATSALWAQDAWKLLPGWKATLGGRLERWETFDGYNYTSPAYGAAGVSAGASQPTVKATNFSPKASLAWEIASDWTTTASFGKAYRYPTVGELYQIGTVNGVTSTPNANLSPERVLSEELAVERQTNDTKLRLSLFWENTSNALIQQTSTTNGTATSYWMNVGEVQNRGVEVVTQQKNAILRGLDLSNSLTFVNSKILADSTWASATGSAAVGRHVPYVPDWRDTAEAVYHANDELAFALAARYQGKMYSTLDNSDNVPHVMGAFDKFFIVDTHAHYQFVDAISADIGIDNLFNDKYFLYHPFPGRTYVADVKVRF